MMRQSARAIQICLLGSLFAVALLPARGESVSRWRWRMEDDRRFAAPDFADESWETAAPGARWHLREAQRGWLRSRVVVPDRIDGKPTKGQPVVILLSAAEGGEIYVDGQLQCRYDNDHPDAALITEGATPGEAHVVAVRMFGPVSGDRAEEFGQADWALIEAARARDALPVRVNLTRKQGLLPRPLAGLSQGGGMADYRPETAAAVVRLRPRWFRMDNVLTAVLQEKDGRRVYDWSDFDRRVGFIFQTGAEPILCLSYMPIPLDAVSDPDRHSAPKDYGDWEDLCYRAARRCIERGKRVRCWEVWNEANAGWLKQAPGDTPLQAYLKLYDASARGIRRADPTAWIGGPCNASGPWDRSAQRGYCVNGETFMRGLIQHCAETGTPLNFITWHEYFHPPQVYREEVAQTQKYLDEYPSVRKQVKGFFLTEFNYAWWKDWPQDHELGAAWAANNIVRAAIPAGITGVCFFYVKDGDDRFRGSYAMLMGENRPKPIYHVYGMFARMAAQRMELEGQDDEICGIASTDPKTGRTTVLLVHFRERYGVPRRVRLRLEALPKRVRGGTLRQYLVDATHSNLFADRAKTALEPECVRTEVLPNQSRYDLELRLLPNSVTLIELTPRTTSPVTKAACHFVPDRNRR